jgi:hypothetical protein
MNLLSNQSIKTLKGEFKEISDVEGNNDEISEDSGEFTEVVKFKFFKNIFSERRRFHVSIQC